MTRPAQYLLMALAFDVYWTLVVMLRERGLLIWLTLARRPPLPRSARASRRHSAPAFSPSGSIRAPLIPNCVSS